MIKGKSSGLQPQPMYQAQNINMAVKIEEVIDLYNKWDKKTTSWIGFMSGNSYPAITSTQQSSEGRTVWVTKSGKKYHNNPNCSKMSSPIEIDLLEAIEKGYEPCGKCYKETAKRK